VRYTVAIAAIIAVTVFYRRVFHANPTTVALTFLILVLFVSANWGFRLASIVAVIATAAFNFFFLPPVGTFTIADPQNWVALAAFLVTAVVASDLAERARRQAQQADQRRLEVERLYAFSQSLLTNQNVLELRNAIPGLVTSVFGLSGATLLLEGKDTIYRSSPDVRFDADTLRTTIARGEPMVNHGVSYIPLRIGVRTTGALAILDETLSRETLDAVGSLIGIALERVRALEEVAQTRASQESERLRTALLDSVTHEFRTPLTSIKASVTSLLSAYELDAAQRNELLTVINEETDRLNRLVGEAAEMAQLDAGMLGLNKQPTDVSELAEAAVAEGKSYLQNHPVEIKIAPNLPKVSLDPARIGEVLNHLLENAAKYSNPDTPIRITAAVEKNMLAVSVADQGPGIDPMEQSLIFDKFYRGRHQRYTASGTGMGLAICKVIVEAHGGTLGVVSQLGQGSVFTFTLPLH
jgi:two-component system, OmpR family, sensor histidine kinase KdpD